MPANPESQHPEPPTPIDVASLGTGPSTPADRRRRRVDSVSSTSRSLAPSSKRPRRSEPTASPSHPSSSPPSPWSTDAMLGVQKGPVSGRPAARKLVIKNRRADSPSHKAEMDKYFDTVWREIGLAVEAVLAGRSVPMPLERVCRGVEDLCRNNMEKEVYDRLKSACERHLAEVVLRTIKAQGGNSDIAVLGVVLSEWNGFNEKSVGAHRDLCRISRLTGHAEIDQIYIQLPRPRIPTDTE